MAYRVRGYPYLETARPQGTAAQLQAGDVDVKDVQPVLLQALERIGEVLRKPVVIFSGYRTSAYSQQVGGFAGDPHSRGVAVDATVGGTPIGLVPQALNLFRSAGITSGNQPGFYRGQPDPAHVQLGAGTPAQTSLGQLWIQAGGSAKVANIMAAIALAESGGRVDAKGGPNTNGTYDYGLWQINSSHGYDPTLLTSNPLYNARAAVAVYRSQGLGAWSTYTNGAYRQFLQGAAGRVPGGTAPRNRPGGEPQDSSAAQDAAWYDWLNPNSGNLNFTWDPLGIFRGAAGAVTDLGSFLKWIAWLFHPRNLLRMVEFLSGFGLIVLGITVSLKTYHDENISPAYSAGKRKGFGEGFALGELGAASKAAGKSVKAADRKRAKRSRTSAGRQTNADEDIPF